MSYPATQSVRVSSPPPPRYTSQRAVADRPRGRSASAGREYDLICADGPAGEALDDHQVRESAWVTVIDGEVEITTSSGESVIGSTGLVVAFAPDERHAVRARTDARLLLLLTPWPGADHPGTMILKQKANVRRDAAERQTNA